MKLAVAVTAVTSINNICEAGSNSKAVVVITFVKLAVAVTSNSSYNFCKVGSSSNSSSSINFCDASSSSNSSSSNKFCNAGRSSNKQLQK